MKRCFAGWILVSLLAPSIRSAEPPRTYPSSGGRLVWDRVRFKPAPGFERDMVGGKFSGSNGSAYEGYEVLAEIEKTPVAGAWNDLNFDGKRPHRWLRYEAPPGSYGHIGKLEFYAGERRLGGPGFGSIGRKKPGHDWPRVFDPNPNAWFESDHPDDQYVGLDVGDAATAVRPKFDPPPGEPVSGPLPIALRTPTPGAPIRYTLDGTTPTARTGQAYAGSINLTSTTTITAAAFKEGFAPSPPVFETYLVGPNQLPGLASFHIGNSITQTTHDFPVFARTAGRPHRYFKFLKPGILTSQLWNNHAEPNTDEWRTTFESLPKLDLFTVQPRQFDVDEEVKAEVRFFQLIRRQSPDVQPWLYAEWTDLYRSRPTDASTCPLPNGQMTKLVPARTWEESASAMLLYVEEVRDRVLKADPAGKRPRVLPSVLAVGWIKSLLDEGKIPGGRHDCGWIIR